MTWDEALDYATALPGAERATYYGDPAAKANGNVFLNVGHEPATSFALHLDADTVLMLLEIHPDTFWQSPHYSGYPIVLVRYDAPDDALVREMIARGRDRALERKPPRPRR